MIKALLVITSCVFGFVCGTRVAVLPFLLFSELALNIGIIGIFATLSYRAQAIHGMLFMWLGLQIFYAIGMMSKFLAQRWRMRDDFSNAAS